MRDVTLVKSLLLKLALEWSNQANFSNYFYPPSRTPPTTLSNFQRAVATFPCRATQAGCNYAQNQRCVTALINGNTPYQSNGATQQKTTPAAANRHQHFLPTAHFQGLETISHSSLPLEISL